VRTHGVQPVEMFGREFLDAAGWLVAGDPGAQMGLVLTFSTHAERDRPASAADRSISASTAASTVMQIRALSTPRYCHCMRNGNARRRHYPWGASP
jgi:hypothetical protein